MKTINWGSEEYKRIRFNFYGRMADCLMVEEFRKELRQFGAAIIYVGEPTLGDSLGMNSFKRIEFSSEEQYLMFLLKWM